MHRKIAVCTSQFPEGIAGRCFCPAVVPSLRTWRASDSSISPLFPTSLLSLSSVFVGWGKVSLCNPCWSWPSPLNLPGAGIYRSMPTPRVSLSFFCNHLHMSLLLHFSSFLLLFLPFCLCHGNRLYSLTGSLWLTGEGSTGMKTERW